MHFVEVIKTPSVNFNTVLLNHWKDGDFIGHIFQPCQMFVRAIMEVNGKEYIERDEVHSNKNSPVHKSKKQKTKK